MIRDIHGKSLLCPGCKKPMKMKYLFEGKEYCFNCVCEKIKTRHDKYYQELKKGYYLE